MDNQTKIERVIIDSVKHLKSIDGENTTKNNYIPESMQPYIGNEVRNVRKQFDILDKTLSLLPKNSDEYIQTQMDREKLAKSLMTMRSQIDLYNERQAQFATIMPNINPGTKNASYYINAAVYGNQWDTLGIDDDGKLHFGLSTSDNPKDVQYHKLDEVQDNSPIITKPFTQMKYVLDLANITKANKDEGKEFDPDWTYNSILNNFTDAEDGVTIGLAHADLAGDGRTKSFVEMYEAGLKDPTLYIHPETGEQLPKTAGWMKDPENAEVVRQLLAKHITNTMSDIAGDIGMRGQVPEVEIGASRGLDNTYGAAPPTREDVVSLPEVTEEEDEDPDLVADRDLNEKVNKHIKKAESLHEGIQTMPKKNFQYYLKRMREAVKGTSINKYLQDLINLRKASKTPEQLIKKYSK